MVWVLPSNASPTRKAVPNKIPAVESTESTAQKIPVESSVQLGIWVPTPWPLESFPRQVGGFEGPIPLIWTSRYTDDADTETFCWEKKNEKECSESCVSVEAATESLGHYECVDLLPGREDIPQSHIKAAQACLSGSPFLWAMDLTLIQEVIYLDRIQEFNESKRCIQQNSGNDTITAITIVK